MTHEIPTEPRATADGRAPRATGPVTPPVAGDAHVAGPPPPRAAADAESDRDTAPDLLAPKSAPGSQPAGQPGGQPAGQTGGPRGRLLDSAEAGRFKERWHRVQARFVDDPAEAVREADALAEEITDALVRSLAEHRRKLSEPLGSGKDGTSDTERLRLALRSYRSLLDHVLET
ncbi:hypothetical protein [Actinomadura terrae]|uniref:hypothetical protein n=1 Tax=Actinomadura terrae TaxID=604353 RepID=UPI001FA7A4F4|nr:hypothetical protein [Actinomadura terrae]